MRPTHATLCALLALGLALPAGAAPRDDWRPDSSEEFATAGEGEANDRSWWLGFEDPVLDELITAGLERNLDLERSQELIAQSRALSFQQLAPALPSVSFDVGANVAPYDARGFSFGGLPSAPGEDTPEVYYVGSAKLNLSLNADLFGRQAHAHQASLAEARAAAGDRDALALALSARIAEAYFDLQLAQARLAVVDEQLRTNGDLLEMVELRFQAGDASAPELLQQRQQLAATQTLLPQARSGLRITRQRLALLLGLGPEAELPAVGDRLPSLPPAPATGRPSELLDNRPDLRASDERLQAAKLKRTGSILSFLPTLRISGNVGWDATYFDEFDSIDTWGAGVSLSVPIFQGTRNWAGLQQANAARRMADAGLESSFLQAVQQVEAARVLEEERELQFEAVSAQLEAAGQAFDETRARYLDGLAGHLQVLSTLGALQQAQLSHLQAQRDLLGARIQLHEALGGTWTQNLTDTRSGGDR